MLCINMAQTFLCYLMLAVFMVMVGYVAGDIQCKHVCQNKTCNSMMIQDTCYYVFKDKRRNWFDSRQFCVEQELTMVKVTKDMIEQHQEYDFRRFFKDIPGEPNAWLGGRAFDLSDWTFLNHTKASTEYQLPSIENNIAHCGYIERALQIHLGGCFEMHPFFCRFNKTNIQRIDGNKSWFEARSHCLKSGGDLFYLHEDEQLNPLLNDAGLTNITQYHHIGFRHRVWEWIDGSEILFTNWKFGEPNKFTEKCLLLYGDSGEWNDNYCYDERLTFCEGAPLTAVTMAPQSVSQDSQNTENPLTAPPAASPPATPIPNYSSDKTDTGKITEDQLRVIVIILGSLLGVFFIISIFFIIYFLITKCSCKSSNEDIEIIENNYYSTSSQPENGLTTTKSNSGTNSADSTVEYSYGPPTAKATNGGSDFTSNKPVIKPKPIIGPKTGDVYSTVDKRSAITPDDTQLYVNSG